MTLKPRAGGSASRGKTKESDKKRSREDKEAVLLVAQEIKFARALAGNEKKSRDRVVKTLRKWVAQRCSKGYEFKEEDFMRVWKGLFYAMWMSDKPLIQEELCESIASLLDAFPAGHDRSAVLFFKCGLQSLATEWYGIDQHRMDKFLMLVRRLLRAAFRCVRREAWSTEACRRLAAALSTADGLLAPEVPAFARNALALQMHLTDCFAEELAKVSEGSLPDAALVELLRPLAGCMALRPEPRLSGGIKRNVFVHLLRQSSAGQEYEERRRAWTQMGCPVGGVDSVEKVAVSDDEDSAASDNEMSGEGALDPRAGRVDVVLQPLPVPALALVEMLTPLAGERRASAANRHRVRTLIQHFKELASGSYPLRTKEIVPPTAPELRMPRPARAARRLHDLEKRLDAQSDELALRGLSRKHRKRVLARHRERVATAEGAASDEGPPPPPPLKRARRRRSDAGTSSGQWQVEEAAPSNFKSDTDGDKHNEDDKQDKKAKNKKRKVTTTLQDEVPLKKLKNLLKQKVTTEDSPKKINPSPKSDQNKTAKAEKELKPILKKTKDLEKATPKSKPKDYTHNISKPRVLVKKIGSPVSKLTRGSPVSKMTRGSPEKVRKFQKKTTESSKLRGKKPERTHIQDKRNERVEESMKITPKKVTIVLKNNTIQGPIDYYKSVKKSPSIPFDSSKKPSKTNLKPNSLPSPIHPFFKKKLRLRA